MKPERFLYLAAVIAAHEGGELIGRTRLQKTMKLLQRKKFPTNFEFRLHYYGPYSEDIQAEIGLLESTGLVSEDFDVSVGGREYSRFKFSADKKNDVPPLDTNQLELISLLGDSDPVVLELAATYDAFRERGISHDRSLALTREKKRAKMTPENERDAMNLLKSLDLPTES